MRRRVEKQNIAQLGLELDLQGWAESKLKADAAAQEYRARVSRVLWRLFCRKGAVNVLRQWSAFGLRQKALGHRSLMLRRRSLNSSLGNVFDLWCDSTKSRQLETGPPLRPPPQAGSAHGTSRQSAVSAEASAGVAPAASSGAYLSEVSAASTAPSSNALQSPPPDRPPPKLPTQAHQQATSPRVPQVLKTNPMSTPFPSLAACLQDGGRAGGHEGAAVQGSPVPALNLSKLAGVFFGGALDTPRSTGATASAPTEHGYVVAERFVVFIFELCW